MRIGSFTVCAIALVGCLTVAAPVAASDSAGAGGAIRVHVRVEAPDRTLFNGVVTTSAKGFTTEPVPGTACDGLTVRTLSPATPSPITALDAALTVASRGFWSDPAAFSWGGQQVGTRGLPANVKPFSFGPELCRIGRWVSNPATGAGWKLKVGNRGGGPAGPISPTAPIGHGASVLWYWSEPTTTRTLDLQLPSRTIARRAVVGRVRAWSNATDQPVAAELVKVGGPRRMVRVRADGSFSLRIDSPGLYVIGASATGAARGSDVICVYRRRSGECGTRGRGKGGRSITESTTPAICPQGAGRAGFDASHLVGLTLAAARERAARYGCTVRPVKVDGESQIVTMDLRLNRVNVELEGGIVTSVRGVG
jgi:hypothetical protein